MSDDRPKRIDLTDSADDGLPTASLYLGDETWHDGPGWYWVDDEYPEDTGAVGAFATPEDAAAHVRGSYRLVVREHGARP